MIATANEKKSLVNEDDGGESDASSAESSNDKIYQSCSSASFLLPLGGFRIMCNFRRLTERGLAVSG